MEFRVLNTSFIAQGIVENVDSIIWTERYYGHGDFEIYLNFSFEMMALLQEDYYLISSDSDRVMIIDTIRIKTDPETGNKLVVQGRSLECLLDRRIVLRQILIDGNWQTGIQSLLNENVIDGLYPERDFPNFIFSASADATITALTLTAQYYSENLYDVIKNLCEQAGVGFKILLNSSNQFVFSLYRGLDRSYEQITNPYIVFSPQFDNLVKSEYFQTKKYKKNYALVSGDPTAGITLRAQAFGSAGEGLNRREIFVNASDMPKFLENTSTEISDADYLDQLLQRGQEVLAINDELVIFEGEVDLSNSYKYRTDFFLGDIIQMVDEYGHSARAQILEMTFSQNLSGSTTYPTLKTI